MWMLWMPDQRPDAAPWPGRVSFAVLDALLWPALWIGAVLRTPLALGVVGPAVIAVASLCLCTGVWKAIAANRRYFFTTRRWLLPIVALAGYGFVLKAFV